MANEEAQALPDAAVAASALQNGWFAVAGFACILLLLGLLSFLIVTGREVPQDSRMLVVFLLATVLAAGFSFIGGFATATGRIPLPEQVGSPVRFSVGGGVAVFVVAVLLGWVTYAHGQGNGATVACGAEIERGQQYYRSGDSLLANDQFSSATQRCPQAVEAWRGMSLAELKLQHYPEALRAAKKATLIDPSEPGLQYNLGLAYARSGDFASGIEILRKYIEAEPSDAEAHYDLGWMLDRSGNPSQARSSYETALRLGGPPAEPAAFNLASIAAMQAHDCESAEAKQAIQLLQQSLDLARNAGVRTLRMDKITGKVKTEFAERLNSVHECAAFVALTNGA